MEKREPLALMLTSTSSMVVNAVCWRSMMSVHPYSYCVASGVLVIHVRVTQ